MATTTTFIGSTPVTGSSATPISAAYNQPAGETIVVACGIFNTSVQPTITDTAGNVYVPKVGPVGGANNYYAWIFVCEDCLANAANVIDVAFTSTGGFSTAWAWHVAGAASSGATNTTASGTGSGTSPASASFTTTSADASIIGFTAVQTGFSTGSAPLVGGVSAVLDGNNGVGGNEGFAFHLDVTSIQTGITADATMSSSQPWATVVVAIGATGVTSSAARPTVCIMQ